MICSGVRIVRFHPVGCGKSSSVSVRLLILPAGAGGSGDALYGGNGCHNPLRAKETGSAFGFCQKNVHGRQWPFAAPLNVAYGLSRHFCRPLIPSIVIAGHTSRLVSQTDISAGRTFLPAGIADDIRLTP